MAELTENIRDIIKMPTIPFQSAQAMLPVETRGGHVSQWDTGVPQFGEGLDVLARQLESFQQQKDAADVNRQLSNAETALATTWGATKDKWENSIKNWDESLPDQAKKDLEALGKVGDSITNEKARLAFQDTLARAMAGAQIELNGYQNKLQINQGIADSLVREDALGQLRSKTNNPDEKKGIDQLFFVHLERDKNSGFITPEEVAKRKIAWEQFARNDDVTSELDVMTKKYGAEATLKYLYDTDNHRALINRSNETTVNRYESQLREKYTLQKSEQAQAKEDYKNKVENDIYHLMATGQVNSQNLPEIRNKIDTLPMDGKIDLDNKLSNFIEKSDPFLKTKNPMLFTDTMTRILHGDPTLTETEIRSHIGEEDGYSAEDGLKAIEKFNTPESNYENKLNRNADDYIKKAIFPPGLIIDAESGDYGRRAQLLYQAQSMVAQKVKEGLANGKSLDDLLMPKFDQNGKIINKQDFVLDNIVNMFAPGATGLQEDDKQPLNKLNPEPPKGFKRTK